jgi:hypothetical protein
LINVKTAEMVVFDAFAGKLGFFIDELTDMGYNR